MQALPWRILGEEAELLIALKEVSTTDRGEFLIRLIHDQDPLEVILEYVVKEFSSVMDLKDIGVSYENLEEKLCQYEKWLHEIWGQPFYALLVGDLGAKALPRAYRTAGERKANVLVADGLSLRELILMLKAFPGRVEYSAGRAFHPTTTQTAARSFYGLGALIEAFRGQKLFEGYEWSGEVIADVKNPPKIGNRKGLNLLTYYPDAPLHNAVKYGVAEVQDVSRVMNDLIDLVSDLTRISDLVVTGDHGYIYLGKNPNKYLWRWIGRSERYGGSYGSRKLEVQGEQITTGRSDAPDVRRSGAFIVHGGASLTESLVPVITIKRES
jgi:hypothetical protein